MFFCNRSLSNIATLMLFAGAATVLAASAEAAVLRLTWRDTSSNESGFRIERANGAEYVEIASVGPNVQTFADTTVAAGRAYCYRVSAFNASGKSASTETACATATGSVSGGSPPQPAPADAGAAPSNSSPQQTAGGGKWQDYRVSMKIRSDDDDVVGVMFRYVDNENYYRFSWFAEGRYRRIEKRVGDQFQTLAEERVPYKPGQTYLLEISAEGSELRVAIDGKAVLAASDATHSEGTIALYSHYNRGARFDDVVVEDLASGKPLLSADFNNGGHTGWTIVDDGDDQGPSRWAVSGGALTQASNIGSPQSGRLGTYALYTRGSWKDYQVSLKMRSSDDDRLGVLFRFQDTDNYYRFSWDRETPGRRLWKVQNGRASVLAEDAVPYVTGQTYGLEIIAQGSTISVRIDGQPVFSASDAAFSTGTVALYSCYNSGSFFDDVLVEDLAGKTRLLWDDFTRGDLAGWTAVDDTGLDSGPSNWSVRQGELVQTSDIGSDAPGHPGAYLIY